MVPPVDDGGGTAPIDRAVLEYLRERLETTSQVATATISDEQGHLGLRVDFDGAYYPDDSTDATLSIRWYTNDDFAIHYRERRSDSDWECRWDRHPNSHNARSHFHPPPHAATPGVDRDWPTGVRDVIEVVFDDIEERIADLWSG